MQSVGIDPGHILIEPEPKNTAPAILAASVFSKYMDPDAIIVVAPSDHVISDAASFHKSILIGIDQVKIGKIVTLVFLQQGLKLDMVI